LTEGAVRERDCEEAEFLSRSPSHLKLELGAAEVGPLLLPEVVRFDDEGDVDAGRERLLQDLQQRLDAVPLGAAHINDDREAMFTHLLAGVDGGRRGVGGNKEEGRGRERVREGQWGIGGSIIQRERERGETDDRRGKG